VRTHDSPEISSKSFYFQYGHASIADLGHAVSASKASSELAATEIEEEPLWDGQAEIFAPIRISPVSGFVARLSYRAPAPRLSIAGEALLAALRQGERAGIRAPFPAPPRPDAMKPEAYRRNIRRAPPRCGRYLLFWGVAH